MENTLQNFRDLIEEFDHGMLTTHTPGGHLSARPMVLQEPRPEQALWMVAGADTSSVQNIDRNPKVNLSFGRNSDKAWISVAATATINRNKRLIQDLWQDSWNVWFREDPHKNSAVLIDLHPEQIDFWEPEHGSLGRLFELAKARFSDSTPDLTPVKSLEIGERELSAIMTGGTR